MEDLEQIKKLIDEFAGVIARISILQMKDMMNETGLSHSQMVSLMELNFKGHCGVSEIADHLGTTDAASSQLVQRLVTLGLVQREESTQDRRAKKITLTAYGKKIVDDVISNRKKMIVELVRNIPPEKHEAILEAISLMVKSAQDLEERTYHDIKEHLNSYN